MWFKREIRILRDAGKVEEATAKLCKTFNISIAHAEEIVQGLEGYQAHVAHDPELDKKVKKLLKEGTRLAAFKEINAKLKDGLLSAKLYLEDIENGLKTWPAEMPKNNAKDLAEMQKLLDDIFGDK